jgi:hypothetical protein
MSSWPLFDITCAILIDISVCVVWRVGEMWKEQFVPALLRQVKLTASLSRVPELARVGDLFLLIRGLWGRCAELWRGVVNPEI